MGKRGVHEAVDIEALVADAGDGEPGRRARRIEVAIGIASADAEAHRAAMRRDHRIDTARAIRRSRDRLEHAVEAAARTGIAGTIRAAAELLPEGIALLDKAGRQIGDAVLELMPEGLDAGIDADLHADRMARRVAERAGIGRAAIKLADARLQRGTRARPPD